MPRLTGTFKGASIQVVTLANIERAHRFKKQIVSNSHRSGTRMKHCQFLPKHGSPPLRSPQAERRLQREATAWIWSGQVSIGPASSFQV